MKRFYPLMFLVFLMPSFSLAQSNYKPGYIVNLHGDTVKGYINYKEWERNPSAISFKTDLNNGTAESVTTANTNAFAITSLEYYRSYMVHISTAQVDMSSIKQGIDTSYITARVFLKILTTGNNITLFSYRDDIKARYYIQDKTDVQPIELIYRQYYNPDNATYVQNENTFRIQLQSLAQKYNVVDTKLQTNMETAQYTDNDMIKIIQKINGNTRLQFTPKSLLGFRGYAGLGVNYNSIKFSGQLSFPSSSNSTFPAVVAGFDLFLNKQTQKLFFRFEISATADQHSFYHPTDATGSSYAISPVKQKIVVFSPQVVYNFYNSGQLQVFIDAGFSGNISGYNSYQLTQTISNVTAPPQKEYPGFNHFWISFPVKTGVILNKKFELYIQYVASALLTNFSYGFSAYEGYVTQYQAGINYLFGVK
jgi:hypothetical protein